MAPAGRSDRIKVLFLAQHLTMGGAEELLLGVARALPRERFEVVVGCLTREGIVAQELRDSGVRVELLPGEPGPRDPLAFLRLYRFVRRERPDVVHTFLLAAGLYGRLAAWLARVPAIFHAEQNVYLERAGRHLALERWLASRTTRVIACCKAVGDLYRGQIGLDAERLEVIYNAIDLAIVRPRADRQSARSQLGYSADDLVVGTLGRLTRQKAHDVLLEAVAQLAPTCPSVRLFVAGQGPLETDLKCQVEALGLTERVKLLGVRRDRDLLYGAMDVFALPSRWEGLSLALVEAWAAGLPVVATNVGGNAEVIADEAGGWLVVPDDPAALAASLEKALAGQRRYDRPEVASRFSLSGHLEQLERSYRRALRRPVEAFA
jgi:glycosyltransferase involved in cell wall biosynthesis